MAALKLRRLFMHRYLKHLIAPQEDTSKLCTYFSSQAISKIKHNRNYERQEWHRNTINTVAGRSSPVTLSLFSVVASGAAIFTWCYVSKNKSKFLNNTFTLFPTVSASSSSHNFLADVVEKALPTVVGIQRILQGTNPFTGKHVSVPESEGSGFIVRSDGLIVTNAHVVGNKTNVNVLLSDGRSVPGVVQAIDRISDLATVKIDVVGLPVLKMAHSSKSRPGEWVVALGSPLRLSNTVTHGIISSTNRNLGRVGVANKGIDYIQTDATIDVGNSGGPLVNMDGQAIGINTLKVTAGIGFAIPSDYAKIFLEKAAQIEKRTPILTSNSGESPVDIKQSYIGIRMLTLTPDIIQDLKFRMADEMPDADSGVLIVGVNIDSPAYTAGLKAGDVITKINNKKVNVASDIYKAVVAGKPLNMTILRGKVTMKFTLIPEEG